MAIVTKKFRDDFDTWASHRIASGEWSETEMADFKDILRQDLTPGPDQLREGIKVIIAAGMEVPAAIDDHEARYQFWADFFSAEAAAIKSFYDAETC